MKAQIFNFNKWIVEIDPTRLKESYTDLLKKSGFNVLNFAEEHFDPHGYTALWLLGESHFAVHTFPEEEKAYIELSSCNEEYYKFFVENLPE